MKPRPRGVENRVAQFLSGWFENQGLSPVERIPVLGREGPDITPNELGMVIDVKSRLQVPKCAFLAPEMLHMMGGVSGGVHIFKLKDLDFLKTGAPSNIFSVSSSLIITGWYIHIANHVRELNSYPQRRANKQGWYSFLTNEEKPNGKAVLVLHRPGMRISSAVMLISETDFRRINEFFAKRDNVRD